MSASVRYPLRAISRAVTIVTDEGASVTGCRRSDAPKTRCTSIRIRSSIGTCAEIRRNLRGSGRRIQQHEYDHVPKSHSQRSPESRVGVQSGAATSSPALSSPQTAVVRAREAADTVDHDGIGPVSGDRIKETVRGAEHRLSCWGAQNTLSMIPGRGCSIGHKALGGPKSCISGRRKRLSETMCGCRQLMRSVRSC